MSQRPSIKCKECGIVQFERRDNIGLLKPCVRCHTELKGELGGGTITDLDHENWFGIKGIPKIANTIGSMRSERKLTQRQVGNRLHVPRTYISKLECDHVIPTLATLDKLATAFDIPPWEILRRAYEMAGENNQ